MLFRSIEALALTGDEIVFVCLLLDACTDDSAAVAASYRARSRFRVVVSEATATLANAGRARHRATQIGLDILDGREGLILNTDADCCLDQDWLLSMTHALQQAEIVTGHIERRGTAPCPLQDRVEAYYDDLFSLRRRLDPVPWEAVATHHHTGGANLGMHAAAYRTVGGFRPLSNGEDARFVDDASRAGLRVRRDASCVVRTSDRRDGRAAAGLAVTLHQLDHAAPNSVRVSHPADNAWQYAMQAMARLAFTQERLEPLGAALGLSRDHALGVARDAPNAEAFAMRIVPVPPAGMRQVPLPEAEAALARLRSARQAA